MLRPLEMLTLEAFHHVRIARWTSALQVAGPAWHEDEGQEDITQRQTAQVKIPVYSLREWAEPGLGGV